MAGTSGIAIDHCELVKKLDGMSREEFMEKVVARVEEIILQLTGKTTKAKTKQAGKQHRAVEVVAIAVANHVIDQGARRITGKMDVEFDELKRQAAAEHISSC